MSEFFLCDLLSPESSYYHLEIRVEVKYKKLILLLMLLLSLSIPVNSAEIEQIDEGILLHGNYEK